MIYISIRESWQSILLVCFLYLFERAHWGCWKIFNVMVIILTCRQSAGPHFLDLVWLSSIPSSALFVAFGGSVILTKPTQLCHWDKLKWWCNPNDSITEKCNRYWTTGRKSDVWRKFSSFFFSSHWDARTTWTQGETIAWIFHSINLELSFWPRPTTQMGNSSSEGWL